MPAQFWTDPLIYQGGSDDLLGGSDDVPFVSEEHGIDLEAEVAVVTDDVPIGTPVDDTASHIRLLMLVNDWTLRNLVPATIDAQAGTADPLDAFDHRTAGVVLQRDLQFRLRALALPCRPGLRGEPSVRRRSERRALLRSSCGAQGGAHSGVAFRSGRDPESRRGDAPS